MKEVLMTTRAILVPVAAALVLAACREPASPASSSSPSTRPAFAVGGGQSGLSLRPGGLGEQSFAKWEAHEGEPDTKGNADQALYFQKMAATPVFAAGFAVIDGLQGQPATALTALSWDHRADGWCGAGAPRWNVGVTDASGDHTVFLGCNAATHSPSGTDGWTSDSRSEEHTSELQSHSDLVCRLLLEKKKKKKKNKKTQKSTREENSVTDNI